MEISNIPPQLRRGTLGWVGQRLVCLVELERTALVAGVQENGVGPQCPDVQLVASDGAVRPPTGPFRPAPRRGVGLVNMGDELAQSHAPRFVVQRVFELGSDASPARRRERVQVLDLADLGDQRGIHPRPLVQGAKPWPVRVGEEPLNAQRLLLVHPDVRPSEPAIPEPEPRPELVFGVVGVVAQRADDGVGHRRQVDAGRNGQVVGQVENLYAFSTARRRGVATQFEYALYHEARRVGLRELVTHIHEANAAARGWAERTGWRPYGTITRYQLDVRALGAYAIFLHASNQRRAFKLHKAHQALTNPTEGSAA